MDKRAILKALTVSAAVTTIVLAILGGYSSTTTPDGITSHHYTFSWFGIWLLLLGLFVFPTTFIIGYPVSLFLFIINLFNAYSIIGVLGAIAVASILFSKFPLAPMLALYYGVGGFVAAFTAYCTYKNITRPSTNAR